MAQQPEFVLEDKEYGLSLHRLADFLNVGSEDTFSISGAILMYRADGHFVEVHQDDKGRIVRLASHAKPENWKE